VQTLSSVVNSTCRSFQVLRSCSRDIGIPYGATRLGVWETKMWVWYGPRRSRAMQDMILPVPKLPRQPCSRSSPLQPGNQPR
jgi:hypothetical protein